MAGGDGDCEALGGGSERPGMRKGMAQMQWKDWDTPDNLAHQPINGPPTRVIAGLLDRIALYGPQIPSPEEWNEILDGKGPNHKWPMIF